jgi:hypothetical protein
LESCCDDASHCSNRGGGLTQVLTEGLSNLETWTDDQAYLKRIRNFLTFNPNDFFSPDEDPITKRDAKIYKQCWKAGPVHMTQFGYMRNLRRHWLILWRRETLAELAVWQLILLLCPARVTRTRGRALEEASRGSTSQRTDSRGLWAATRLHIANMMTAADKAVITVEEASGEDGPGPTEAAEDHPEGMEAVAASGEAAARAQDPIRTANIYAMCMLLIQYQ